MIVTGATKPKNRNIYYFIESRNQLWRTALDVRHVFHRTCSLIGRVWREDRHASCRIGRFAVPFLRGGVRVSRSVEQEVRRHGLDSRSFRHAHQRALLRRATGVSLRQRVQDLFLRVGRFFLLVYDDARDRREQQAGGPRSDSTTPRDFKSSSRNAIFASSIRF
jgi:hypothetical protein